MENKNRKPWLAGILTILTIGLGHLYAGEPRRGLVFYLAQFILLVIFLPILLFGPPLVILFLLIICGLVYLIYCLLDAVKIAKKKIDYQLNKYNKWYIYVACWVVAVFILQPVIKTSIKTLINNHVIQAYKIPSDAMTPTLLPGDHILVDKFIYKNHEPQRGDLVIFPFPEDLSTIFVKRLIGLEGDKIEIRDKQLYINDQRYIENYIIHIDPIIMSLENGPRDNFGPVVVTDGNCFVMGDNRDNSHDSRYFKFVNKKTVEGKVKSIYWSWDKERSKVRWKRIGKSIGDLNN